MLKSGAEFPSFVVRVKLSCGTDRADRAPLLPPHLSPHSLSTTGRSASPTDREHRAALCVYQDLDPGRGALVGEDHGTGSEKRPRCASQVHARNCTALALSNLTDSVGCPTKRKGYSLWRVRSGHAKAPGRIGTRPRRTCSLRRRTRRSKDTIPLAKSSSCNFVTLEQFCSSCVPSARATMDRC